MNVRFASFLIITLSFSFQLKSQERCGTVPYTQKLLTEKGIPQSTEQFEGWLQEKLLQRGQRMEVQRQQTAHYKIPVVVHIIHNGQSVGTGMNLSDAQILSQIDVLNKDFQRLNADASNTPTEFLAVAGSLDIEFILAKQTPEGLPTTGIVRINGGQASWAPFDEALNAKSYWPSEDYLNIWVTNIGSNFLGYAQFPVSNLPGLEEYMDGLAPTDGVVIDFTVFGVGSSDPQYNMGRTTTHEVGHFLGLRHIWGDEDGCSATDYVSDTPSQDDETYDCPSHPQVDCTTNKMFQNFLDYTDDVCMNLFTQGQVDRMTLILESTSIPRRKSLLTSHGLDDPICGTSPPVDVAILAVQAPGPVTCNRNPNLILFVKNLSCPIITSIKIDYMINGGTMQSSIITGLSIQPTSEDLISVGALPLNMGENTISVTASLVNGNVDSNMSNSDTQFTIVVNGNEDFIPLRETFNNNSLNAWTVASLQPGILWDIDPELRARFPGMGGTMGEESWLVSPVLNLESVSEASVFFTLFYSWTGQNDRLRILASTTCGDSYFQLTPGFDLQGSALQSNGNKKYLSLTALAGLQQVRIAFVATSMLGENIYVDDIEFFEGDDPTPIDPGEKPFTLYWGIDGGANITFKLTDRQPVGFSISDTMGRKLSEAVLPDMLNQTIPITGINSSGIYIIRLQIGKKYYAIKAYLSP